MAADKLIIYAATALLCAVFLFGLVSGYRHTGTLTVFWQEGVGGTAVPAGIALIWATVRKLFSYEKNFLLPWLITFLVFATLFLASSYTSASNRVEHEMANSEEALEPSLIEILKASHAETCKVSIKSQRLSMTDEDIDQYCRCVGDAYFSNFTQKDFDELEQSGLLPRRLLDRREDIQVECSANHFSE